MLYIERDAAGNIISINNNPGPDAGEQKSLMDKEIIEFLQKNAANDPAVQLLSLSDIGIIRILEDLIDLLVRKNIILFTDLPEEAQAKISERKQLRNKIPPDHLISDDIL
jgi:hypothetical protein